MKGSPATLGLSDKLTFRYADVRQPLPFARCNIFDAIVSMDALCHFPNRVVVFGDWIRVLRPGGRLLYTDPVVVTGLVSNEELAQRSSTGHFEFCPDQANEPPLLQCAGFELVAVEDVTENAAQVSGRWHDARERRAEAIQKLEGPATSPACNGLFDRRPPPDQRTAFPLRLSLPQAVRVNGIRRHWPACKSPRSPRYFLFPPLLGAFKNGGVAQIG